MTTTAEQRRRVLAEIARERLIELVYGEITTDEQYAELAALAEAAGVELALVLPTTGEPGHDPRTRTPQTDEVEEEESADGIDEAQSQEQAEGVPRAQAPVMSELVGDLIEIALYDMSRARRFAERLRSQGRLDAADVGRAA